MFIMSQLKRWCNTHSLNIYDVRLTLLLVTSGLHSVCILTGLTKFTCCLVGGEVQGPYG